MKNICHMFVGPSGYGVDLDTQWLGDVVWHPPVKRRDIERLIAEHPVGNIAIADGTFHRFPAVSHIEIRDALSAGWRVWGLCSMGAIGLPFVYGSISQFEGQLSVFNHTSPENGVAINYRDLFPEQPPTGFSQNCAEAGVIGVLPGLIGLMQANEVIKILTGLGEPLVGRLLSFDALTCRSSIYQIKKRSASNPLYKPASGSACLLHTSEFPSITIQQFNEIAITSEIQLVDVRTCVEREADSLGGIHIPLLELPRRISELQAEVKTIIYCQSGIRSASAQAYLIQQCRFLNVFNLSGGINAFRESLIKSGSSK